MCCVSVDSEEQTDLNYTFNTYYPTLLTGVSKVGV